MLGSWPGSRSRSGVSGEARRKVRRKMTGRPLLQRPRTPQLPTTPEGTHLVGLLRLEVLEDRDGLLLGRVHACLLMRTEWSRDGERSMLGRSSPRIAPLDGRQRDAVVHHNLHPRIFFPLSVNFLPSRAPSPLRLRSSRTRCPLAPLSSAFGNMRQHDMRNSMAVVQRPRQCTRCTDGDGG